MINFVEQEDLAPIVERIDGHDSSVTSLRTDVNDLQAAVADIVPLPQDTIDAINSSITNLLNVNVQQAEILGGHGQALANHSQSINALNGAVTAIDERLDVLEARPSGGGDPTAYNPFGIRWLDGGDFGPSGPNDNAKTISLNAYWKDHIGKPKRIVGLDAREHVSNVPWEMWSGAGAGAFSGPAREFNRHCRWTYNGPAGTGMFKFVGPQGYQGYPADGSPRDLTFFGIEFNIHTDKYFIEPTDVLSGKTLWCASFHDIGIIGTGGHWLGFGDNVQWMTGISHAQAHGAPLKDAILRGGGSECQFWDGGEQSVIDSGNAAWAASGKPYARLAYSKSDVGKVMLTTRRNTLAMEVYGGHGLAFHGFKADCQDSDPDYGAQVRWTGGKNGSMMQCSFKGAMTNPSQGPGGSALNQGIVQVTNHRHLTLEGNAFHREGNNQPPTTTPLVAISASAPDMAVAWGLNQWADYEGYLSVARREQVYCLDGRMKGLPSSIAGFAKLSDRLMDKAIKDVAEYVDPKEAAYKSYQTVIKEANEMTPEAAQAYYAEWLAENQWAITPGGFDKL